MIRDGEQAFLLTFQVFNSIKKKRANVQSRRAWKTESDGPMKIRVESDKIVKAVRKLEGIEIVLENADDAKEALDLILDKVDILAPDDRKQMKAVKVTAMQKYETSAVDYKMIFLIEFVFDERVETGTKISFIKGLQQYFEKI
jgi:hypothetical protein